MKPLLWIVFLIVLVIMGYQGAILLRGGAGIIDLELSHKMEGLTILQHWQNTPYGDATLLDVAFSNTRTDFVFIASYVLLMITMSNWQMQREKWFPLNELLRFNLFAISITGLLDVVENLILLHNFHHLHSAFDYYPTFWISAVKFFFAGLTVLVFLISWIKSSFLSLSPKKDKPLNPVVVN